MSVTTATPARETAIRAGLGALGATSLAIAAFQAIDPASFVEHIGPFGTAIDGDDELVVETVATILRAALAHGATRVSVQVESAES